MEPANVSAALLLRGPTAGLDTATLLAPLPPWPAPSPVSLSQ